MRELKKILSKFVKAELKNKDLKLIAKKSQIHLWLENEKITQDLGLHTAICFNDEWYSSAMGIWQIKVLPDMLQVTIDWEKIPVRQLWHIKKQADGFNWLVYMDIKEAVCLQKTTAGIMLRQEYEQWFSSVEDGVFPGFNNIWEPVFLQDEKTKIFGVKSREGLPAVLCENLQQGVLSLQNSPQALVSRALRIENDYHGETLSVNRYKSFNCSFLIFTQADRFTQIRQEKNKQLLTARRLESGALCLDFSQASVNLLWNDKKMTVNQGLHTALKVNNEWFDSSRCDWTIERINDQCMYINVDWRPLPIRQSWQLHICNDHSFIWKVKTELKEKRKDMIEAKTLGLIVKNSYQEWFGGYEQGTFPLTFTNWQEMVRDIPLGAVGVVGSQSDPAVLFKNNSNNKTELLVQNSDENTKARYLQAVGIDGNNQEFDFVQEVSIIEDKQKIQDYICSRMDEKIMQQGIAQGKIKVLADKGKVRIFSEGKEVTTDIGLHSALYSSGHWYDSGKMEWDIKKLTPEKLQVLVDFNPFPAVQTWDIYFKKDATICWDISMNLKKDVEIKERKAGIMLSGDYERWFNSFEVGVFPEEFGFWHDIIRNRDGETFGTYPKDNLPGVMFKIDDNNLSLIQNTDKNIKGRVLQAQVIESDETKGYKAQKNLCFNGEITFVDDSEQIEIYKKESQPLPQAVEAIYFYADNAQLHDRIAKVVEFDQKIAKIESLRKIGKSLRVAVGVSRYNFFKLNEICQFIAEKLGYPIDLRSIKLNIFPLNRLRRNFIEYLEELKNALREINEIELVLVDNELFELITAVCVQSDTGSERQLLRLLGVICENAFIGPQIVVIDPYHRCNSNCVHCWVHTPGVSHSHEFYDMKLDLARFKAIADDLSELMVDLIIFQGDGEPLLNKEFFDMVRYARKKGIKVSFFTNGILLNNDIAREVVELGIEEIFCSLPAGSSEVFGKVNTKQKPEVFNTILENLKYLCDYKKKKNKTNPRLIMTHVIHNLNAHELLKMAHSDVAIGADVARFYLIRLDKNIEFLKLNPENITIIKDSWPQIKNYLKDKDIKLLDTTEFQLNNFEPDTGSWSKDVFLEKGCVLGWKFSLIPASGEVSFCCHLRTVGFLDKQTFKDIWESEDYKKFRYQAKFLNEHKDSKFLNGNPLFDDYCQHCDTHQVIRDVWDELDLYGLDKFLE